MPQSMGVGVFLARWFKRDPTLKLSESLTSAQIRHFALLSAQ